MQKALPARPHWDHLKEQAKDLLAAYRHGEDGAFARFRRSLPAAKGKGDHELAAMKLALHDAQSVIAREYGFDSWADLRDAVESQAPSRAALEALMAQHFRYFASSDLLEALSAEAAREVADPPLSAPRSVPLLALRNVLLTAGSVAPLDVGRPSSLSAIAAAGTDPVAMFAQKDPADEEPTELHPVGVLATVVRSIPHDGGTAIVVRALEWVSLDAIEQRAPYVRVRVSPFRVRADDSEETRRLTEALRSAVTAAVTRLPQAQGLLRRVANMNALQLADAAVANTPATVAEKAAYAALPELRARLETASTWLARTSG